MSVMLFLVKKYVLISLFATSFSMSDNCSTICQEFHTLSLKERLRNAEAQLEKKWNFTLGEDEVELQKRQSSSPGRLI